jgi:hypothetical protein
MSGATSVTITGVREILALRTADIRDDLLPREADGSWPENPLSLVLGDTVALESIEFSRRSRRSTALLPDASANTLNGGLMVSRIAERAAVRQMIAPCFERAVRQVGEAEARQLRLDVRKQ